MSEYFPEPKSLGRRVKFELALSNYCNKNRFKKATGVDTSSFAKKADLASLKSGVDKLDVDKLVPVPVDLSKVSNVVVNDVVEKDLYNAKIKNIENKIPDITNLATNASLNAKINEVKGETPNITNVGTNASPNAKINEVKGEISNTTNLGTTTALTAVEIEIPSASNLVKKLVISQN